MRKIRLRYSKTDSAAYISHLDLMATMQRALLRAGIRLSYSSGFNPHPYMSVALPLSVGCASTCELMDIGVLHDDIPDDLPAIVNTVLPAGIKITGVYDPVRKFNDIAWVEINGILHYDNNIPVNAAKKLTELFSSKSIIIQKKSKRGVSELDIAPHIRDIVFDECDILSISAKLSAQNPTINPNDLLNAVNETMRPDHLSISRIEIYDRQMNVFK